MYISRLTIFRYSLVIIFNIVYMSAVYSETNTVNNYIKANIDKLNNNKELNFNGESISAIKVIPAFYDNREYSPAWGADNIGDLLDSINDIENDGLNPRDYHYQLIIGLMEEIVENGQKDPEKYALFDIFLTDSLLRLTYHILVGKVDPERLDPNWNLAKDINQSHPEDTLQRILDTHNIPSFIEGLKPDHFYYKRMKKALAYYRDLKQKGGWNFISQGSALKPGMSGDSVIGLRKRLLVTGDLVNNSPADERFFDRVLEEGIKAFQRRHGLIDDGVVGANTINALNVPVEERVDQIRVNLERSRWVLQNLPSYFLVVNIAGFTVFLVKNGEPVWTSKVIVGKKYRKTPVFKAKMKYIDFNPTWTIPPTILRNDMLPSVKKDKGYLMEQRIRVLDQNGKEIPQNTINWSKYSGRNFPYILRQDPGPDNALGLVKFMFPNKHFVYLHDTPSKSLFEMDMRTFSSGCIRVENPFELAELLLNDNENWNRDSINKVIDQEKTRTVNLKKQIPVLVLYWTSRVDEDGKVEFLPDVYKRDIAILRELDAGFKIRK